MMESMEIKLKLQSNEDIVLIMQGLNEVRGHIIRELERYNHLLENSPEKFKKKLDEETLKVFEDSTFAHDRILSMLAQLSKILEEKQ